MSEFIRIVESKISEMWVDHPSDIDRMLEREGACGSHFTIVMFVKTDTQNAANTLYQLYSMAKEKNGDLETIKKIGGSYFSFMGNRFRNYYHMNDTVRLSLKAAVLMGQTKTHEDAAELLKAMQRYFNLLAYWVDFSVPWKEMSEEYEKLLAEKKAAYGI